MEVSHEKSIVFSFGSACACSRDCRLQSASESGMCECRLWRWRIGVMLRLRLHFRPLFVPVQWSKRPTTVVWSVRRIMTATLVTWTLSIVAVCHSVVVLQSYAQEAPLVVTQDMQLVQEIESPPNAPNHLWARVQSIGLDETGRMLVLYDSRMTRVSVLDALTLDLLWTWGKQGRGPGELANYSAWVTLKEGVVLLCQNFKLSYFSVDGRFLDKDIPLLRRAGWYSLSTHESVGVDTCGSIYYLAGQNVGNFEIRCRASNGQDRVVFSRSAVGVHKIPGKGGISFGTHADGSSVVSFGHKPLLIKFDTHGNIKWTLDFLKDLSSEVANQIEDEYQKIVKKNLPYPWSAFWTDSTYTVLTLPLDWTKERIGKPSVLYLFINSKTGRLMKVSYPKQNVVERPSDGENDVRSHTLYAPWVVAHSRGYLYAFCYNNSRLVKYKLMWAESN